MKIAKPNSNYFCMHDHTNFSCLDSNAQIKDKLEKAKELGFNRVVFTDHGNISNLPYTFEMCEKLGIQAGCGIEFYIIKDEYKNIKNTKNPDEDIEKLGLYKPSHITVMVLNEVGYQNLLKLIYLSNIKEDEEGIDGFEGTYYYKARITDKMLFAYQEGLLITSGCRLSMINKEFLAGNVEEAERLIKLHSEKFDNFIIELHMAHNPIEELMFEWLTQMAHKYNIKTIPANDCHYVNKGELINWNLFNSIRMKSTYDKTEKNITNDDFYMLSEIEAYTRIYELNKGNIKLTNATFSTFDEIQNLMTFNWANRRLEFPSTEDHNKELYARLQIGLINRFGSANKVPEAYMKRLRQDFDTAVKTKNSSYYLLVHNLINKAISRGIKINPGRGSAASLLILYLLGITYIDPIKYKLIGERASNPDRVKLMDIDLDFAHKDEEVIMQILREQHVSVLNIINFGEIKDKGAVQYMGKYLKIRPDVVDRLTKEFDKIGIDEAFKINKEISSDQKVLLKEYSNRIKGGFDKWGKHASGVILRPEKIYEIMPVTRVGNSLCTSFDMGGLDKVNCLKLDVLKVEVADSIELIEEKLGLFKK